MTKDILKYGLIIFLLPVLQEMIFNNINLFGFINPMVYIVVIFIFPVYKDRTWILLTAFSLGIMIDFLTNDNGINAFAMVFVAYLRFIILRFIKGVSFENTDVMDITNLDDSISITWIVIITFIHHFIVFFLEQFSFHLLGHVLLKTILTTILTSILLTFGMQLLNNKKHNVW